MSLKTILPLFILFAVIHGSCTIRRAPLFKPQQLTTLARQADDDSSGSWAIDSLSPAENTILVAGTTTPVSVDLTASGTGSYLVYLHVNGKKFKPFKLSVLQNSQSQANFSGKLSWFLKVRGKVEHVAISLYQVKQSSTGKTECLVLLKQIERNYNAVCNSHQWKPILFLKAHIFCSCQLSVTH